MSIQEFIKRTMPSIDFLYYNPKKLISIVQDMYEQIKYMLTNTGYAYTEEEQNKLKLALKLEEIADCSYKRRLRILEKYLPEEPYNGYIFKNGGIYIYKGLSLVKVTNPETYIDGPDINNDGVVDLVDHITIQNWVINNNLEKLKEYNIELNTVLKYSYLGIPKYYKVSATYFHPNNGVKYIDNITADISTVEKLKEALNDYDGIERGDLVYVTKDNIEALCLFVESIEVSTFITNNIWSIIKYTIDGVNITDNNEELLTNKLIEYDDDNILFTADNITLRNNCTLTDTSSNVILGDNVVINGGSNNYILGRQVYLKNTKCASVVCGVCDQYVLDKIDNKTKEYYIIKSSEIFSYTTRLLYLKNSFLFPINNLTKCIKIIDVKKEESTNYLILELDTELTTEELSQKFLHKTYTDQYCATIIGDCNTLLKASNYIRDSYIFGQRNTGIGNVFISGIYNYCNTTGIGKSSSIYGYGNFIDNDSDASIIYGNNCKSVNSSMMFGYGLIDENTTNANLIFGLYNEPKEDVVLSIACGTSDTDRKNILEYTTNGVLRDGNEKRILTEDDGEGNFVYSPVISDTEWSNLTAANVLQSLDTHLENDGLKNKFKNKNTVIIYSPRETSILFTNRAPVAVVLAMECYYYLIKFSETYDYNGHGAD